jgi:pyrimidine operon attenuation protein / uracil phosphoribosyltransferase
MTLNTPENRFKVSALLAILEKKIKHTLSQRQLNDPLLIGIRTGGVWVAEKLHQRLAIKQPLGLLDISFYRDDFSQIGLNPNVKPSHLPAQIEGRNIILIDDVFHTGRTVRAALNEIFDYGRPKQVVLAVLIERDGKQIPIRPDCVGVKISLAAAQRIKLTGPEPLAIEIRSVDVAA